MSSLISILTPSFGYGRFIDDCLDSVSMQNDRMEHVVQDGGSTDETVAKLEARPGLLWESVPDRGQSDALNRALARSSGEWIGWLNADEFYLPGGPSLLLDRALSSNADVVFGDPIFVDESGRYVRLVTQHPFHALFLRKYGCFISSCGVLMKRDVLGDDPWDEGLRMAMDWDLYLKLVAKGARFHYVPAAVAAFRLHPAQVIARHGEYEHEHNILRDRYGVAPASTRKLMRWPHDLYKLVTGAYPRQVRSNRSLKGNTLRWFADPRGYETVAGLRKNYRLPAST